MRHVCLTAVVSVALSLALSAQQWPQWRGPDGSGVVRDGRLPLSWSDSAGVAWRVKLAGSGVSTPVAAGEYVFVTSQIGTGERRPGNHPSLVQGGDPAAAGESNLTARTSNDQITFVVAAHQLADGSAAWQHRIAAEGPMPGLHDKHNMATPSPVADNEVVVAWFGTGQIVGLSTGGVELWSKHLGLEHGPFDIMWGHASSPVLHGDLVLLVCYHASQSYVLALDKRTGEVRWKQDRQPGLLSYSTPLVVETAGGAELVINASDGLEAISIADGSSRWRLREDNRFPIPVATVSGGVLYTTRGYRSGPYYAIRLGGRGDVTDTHVQWRVPTGAPYVSSLIHYDGLVYTSSETGIVTCLDAGTGERVWQERAGGVFTASPIAGDGRIYLVSEAGETVVLRAGRTFEVLARNRLTAHLVASPIAAGGRIILRSDDELIAVGGRAEADAIERSRFRLPR
ncbi:MAG TPA: PQQ-binding-like beta-propeller repeat protein [Vicinamibacterales bacterium]|nr:PQQ-binding-like beta-propeller repeat protein [Vicinamibacterales bacterium]